MSNSGNSGLYRLSQKTWEFSDELDIVFVMNWHCIVIPNNIIMSARVYFMKWVKTVKMCLMSIMSPQGKQ